MQLTNCPRCAYKLEGLPGRGQCPECGLRYNEEMRLFPITPHTWWSTRTGRLLPIIFGMIGCLMVIRKIIQGSVFDSLAFYLIMSCSLLFIAWHVEGWLIGKRVRSMVQIKEQNQSIFFNSRGMALRKQGRLLTLWPWKSFDMFSLEEYDSGMWRLQLRPAAWRPTLAPTIDADLLLANKNEVKALRNEIMQWFEASGKCLRQD